MAERNNATCSICGNEYYMCLSCKDSIKVAPWKVHTDTAEHYKVFQVIRGYSTGVYNKKEAKDKLKNIDLRDLNSFRPHIKKIIKDILKEEKVAAKVVEEVVDKEPHMQHRAVEIAVVENNAVAEQAVAPRKRNYKVEAE